MQTRSKNVAVLALCLLTSPILVGCHGMVARAALGEVKGGSGKVTIIKPIAGGTNLTTYKYARLEVFKNTMGSTLPAGAVGQLKAKILKALTRKPQMFDLADENAPDQAPVLIIRGQVLHYQPAGGIGAVLGKFAQLICRVQLVDGSSGQVIGEANCSAVSKAIARAGISDLSAGVAKALAKWLKHSHKSS